MEDILCRERIENTGGIMRIENIQQLFYKLNTACFKIQTKNPYLLVVSFLREIK